MKGEGPLNSLYEGYISTHAFSLFIGMNRRGLSTLDYAIPFAAVVPFQTELSCSSC